MLDMLAFLVHTSEYGIGPGFVKAVIGNYNDLKCICKNRHNAFHACQ